MNPFFDNLKQLLSRLTLGQKAALGSVIVGGLVLFLSIAYWAAQPDYALLFGRLEPTDASRVVEKLQEQGIAYDLKESGTAIYVPRNKVYELRLEFAGEGLISDGPEGYELFDKGTLGMTDFMQKVNMRRAMEGELARTISSLRQVEVARVHLVIPERSPFRESQNAPKASVVLQLVGGSRLAPQQVEGITALVSAAVEGLSPNDVSLIDTRGNMLSNPDAGNADLMLSTTQLRMQRATEDHLSAKGQSMLDRVLGPGNAIVRVNSTLDFDRAVSERELIDPESATVISEERLEEDNADLGQANSQVRNYELSRTIERQEKSVGSIDFLTVSVILNQRPGTPDPEDPEAPVEPQPYTDAELEEIEALVKNAVGFRPDRGDTFALHQTQFDTSAEDQMQQQMQKQRWNEDLQIYLRYGFMLLALVLAAWLIRSASRKATTLASGEEPDLLNEGRRSRRSNDSTGDGAYVGEGESSRLLEAGEDDDLVLVDDVYTSKLSPEAKARLKAKHMMFEEIQQQVVERPEDTAELIRSWMADELEHEPAHA